MSEGDDYALTLDGMNDDGVYAAYPIVAHDGANQSSPDVFESYLRLRLYSRLRMQQSIMEYRLASGISIFAKIEEMRLFNMFKKNMVETTLLKL